MQRRRRTERKRMGRWSGWANRVLLGLSAVVVLAGIVSRIRGGNELTATVVATPSPTPLTAAFDEAMGTRQLLLEAEGWYCLQSGVFSTLEAAQAKSGAYAGRGAPGFVAPDGDKFRVLLSAYGAREDALRVKDRLSAQQGVETYIYEMIRPALHLQLSGMRGQLDVIDAATALLPTLARSWRDAALLVDQGELTPGELTALAGEGAEQSRVMLRVLEERFLSPAPPLARQLQQLCSGAEASAERIGEAAQDSLTAASAQLKMEALALHQALKTVWEAILADGSPA